MFDSFLMDESRHLRIPLACAFALVGLIGIGTFERAPAVEKHLEHDITDSLLVDLPGIQVKVDGRDVTLIGAVDSLQERNALRAAVERRWGVRSVSVHRLRVNEAAAVPAPTVDRSGRPSSAASTSGPNPSTTISSSANAGSSTGSSGGPNGPSSSLPFGSSTIPSASSTSASSTLVSSNSVSSTTISPPAGLSTPGLSTGTTTAPTTTPPTTTVLIPTTFPVSATTRLPTTTLPVAPSTVQPTPIQQQLVEASISEILLGRPLVFARNAPTLAPESSSVLDLLAVLFRENPDVAIRIESFTDNRGKPGNNLALSQRRADAVRIALVARGVQPGQIQAVGRGEASPIADNTTEAGRTLNRRVELIVVRQRVP